MRREQANALMARAAELTREAGECDESRNLVLASARELRAKIGEGMRRLPGSRNSGRYPAWLIDQIQTLNSLLDRARELAEARDRLLTLAAELRTQAQDLIMVFPR